MAHAYFGAQDEKFSPIVLVAALRAIRDLAMIEPDNTLSIAMRKIATKALEPAQL